MKKKKYSREKLRAMVSTLFKQFLLFCLFRRFLFLFNALCTMYTYTYSKWDNKRIAWKFFYLLTAIPMKASIIRYYYFEIATFLMSAPKYLVFRFYCCCCHYIVHTIHFKRKIPISPNEHQPQQNKSIN